MILFKFKSSTSLRWCLILTILSFGLYLSVNQFSRASLYGIFNIFTVNLNEDFDSSMINDGNHLSLENVSQHQFELQSSQLKIFFLQTSENDDILSRHGCSIESAARLHSHGLVFVLMRSRTIHLRKGAFQHLINYKNLRFLHFNEEEIYFATTLAQLKETKRKQYIRYFAISHMSDFLRTALLFKYGGIYFDLDVIPLRNFSIFRNTVALESTDGVNVAVLAFEKQHLVLDIQMDLQLASMKNQFNAFCWNCVGPVALSNALKHVCDQEKLTIHSQDQCQQIDIQPSFVFYPIDYREIPQFFRRSTNADDLENLMNNSTIYSIHYFHHMTMNLPVEAQSPFARLAQRLCPQVSSQLIDQTISIDKSTGLLTFVFKSFHHLLFYLTIFFLCFLVIFYFANFSLLITTIRTIILAIQQTFRYDRFAQ